MPRTKDHSASATETLKLLSEGLLRSAGRTGVRGHVLEIHHPFAPLFDPVLLHPSSEMFGTSISLSQDKGDSSGQRVRCDSLQLPFQDGSFSMVVLHHVISRGRESELVEAKRVLARRGVLLVLGLNRLGWRYQTQDRVRRLPGLAPLRVKSALESLELTMQGFAGAGLGGGKLPAFMSRGLSGLAVPVADVLLLQARHKDSPELTPLRFREAREANSGVGRAAAA